MYATQAAAIGAATARKNLLELVLGRQGDHGERPPPSPPNEPLRAMGPVPWGGLYPAKPIFRFAFATRWVFGWARRHCVGALNE